MTISEIKHMQRRIGVVDDGFWGPVSTKACRDYLISLMPHPYPFPPQSRVSDYYGPHGVPDGYDPPRKEIILPFDVYFDTQTRRSLHPHVKCADSLQRVFVRLHTAFPTHEDKELAGILNFDGLYNPRLMRGGTAWSMHAWAIAYDMNAKQNGNFDHWPTKASMPLEVMECFALEGWTSAGAFWSRDAMHFQALSPT